MLSNSNSQVILLKILGHPTELKLSRNLSAADAYMGTPVTQGSHIPKREAFKSKQ